MNLEVVCKASRSALLSPDAFEAMLRKGMAREAAEAGTGFRFTNGKDETSVCIPQYREGFLRLIGEAGMLTFFAVAGAMRRRRCWRRRSSLRTRRARRRRRPCWASP